MIAAEEPRHRPAAAPRGPSAKLPSGVDLDRLVGAIEGARRALQKYREERVKAVKEFAGRHYSDGGIERPVPVNLIALYVSIMSRSLVAKNPRVMLSTHDRDRKPAVAACEAWLNREAERMGLGQTLHRIVVDALFSVGIAKVGLAAPGDAAVAGWGLSAGTPFVDRVDLDDFVVDVYARDFAEATFIGHRYRVPLEVARSVYRRGRRRLEAEAERPDHNPEGDERIGLVGRGTVPGDAFEEEVSLWEIYLPRHRVVLTLLDGASGVDPTQLLEVRPWVGADTGPYHVLGFGVVPGAAMPKAPVMDLIDLHRAVNRAYVKLIEDTDRWKSVLLVPGSDDEEAKRLTAARNGTAIRFDGRPESAKETVFGGPGAGVFQMGKHMWDLFSKLAGNLEVIGGLAPQSRTATQDKMLDTNASRTVGDMQETVVSFVARVMKAMMHFHWLHPQKVMEAHGALRAAPDVTWPRRVHPGGAVRPDGAPHMLRRDGPVPDVDVHPHSLTFTTPQARLAFVNGFVQQVQPLLGLLQQQGVMFDAKKYVEMVERCGDVPEIADIFRYEAPPEPAGGQPEQPGMPAQTSREYVRRSLGGESDAAQDNALQTALARDGGANFNGPMGS